jgi:predicted RNA binding protein YcfA (HicA-like mRNA interferase family)
VRGMKRKDLINKLEKNGWWKLREGANHEIYTNGKASEPIPRYTEVNELLAKAIVKRQGLK